MNNVRVRFAPSPTGPLHIGGVRTALFNYLFARKHGGVFYLRIEDTDQSRFVLGAEDYIIDSLKWLGIEISEGGSLGGPYGPYRQSDRKAIYKQYADQLLASGSAYYAFDSAEELDKLRKDYEIDKKTFSYDLHTRMQLNNSLSLSKEETQKRIASGEHYVLRFKMPDNIDVRFKDMVRDDVHFNTNTLDDKVLFKSDGMPTYHLANVVDDYLMKTSHVIRGEEWLPSTPLHVLLYIALGWEGSMPQFAHLPLILKPSGQGKLSKRDGDKMGFPVFPLQWKDPVTGEVSAGYRESGYFPESLVNILAFLGWNPGSEKEFFSMAELVDVFSLEKVQKAGARFDPEKAKWFNHHYLKQHSDDELADAYIILLKERNIVCDKAFVTKVVSMVKERAVFVKDLWDQSYYFFEAPLRYDEKVIAKYWKGQALEALLSIADLLNNLADFKNETTEDLIKNYISNNNLGMGQVMNSLRLALVGTSMGPHLTEIMEMIGKGDAVKRIRKFCDTIPLTA